MQYNKKFLFSALLLMSNIFFTHTFASNGEKRMFTLTGYYSPLPNQNFYITGDYESEKRLNGQGIRGADGTPVFPGMIAAPADYTFGTKVCLPNFGCGSIHDRGGAIVKKGERNLARHDRLDLWLGFGEEGLLRALSLGVDHVEGTIYSPNTPINVAVNFQAVTPLSKILDLPQRIEFKDNLYKGILKQEQVITLQENLKRLGFFDSEVNGIFGEATKEAVFLFQKKNFILENRNDQGAGSFGPMTRSKFSEVLYKKDVQEKIAEKWAEFHFDENIRKGKRSADVLRLQEVLIQEEFMDHMSTGYFGNITKEALIEFQIAKGIISNKHTNGAGNVGPKTREFLNQLLEKEKEADQNENNQILAYEQDKQKLQYFAGINSNNNFVQK